MQDILFGLPKQQKLQLSSDINHFEILKIYFACKIKLNKIILCRTFHLINNKKYIHTLIFIIKYNNNRYIIRFNYISFQSAIWSLSWTTPLLILKGIIC